MDTTQYQVEQEEETPTIDHAAIINEELSRVGILTLFEGTAVWKKRLETKTWYSYRGAYYELHYDFGLACSLENIGIVYEDNIVYISINKGDIYLEKLELMNDESIMHSESSWLAKEYSAQEVNAVLTVANEQVTNHIAEQEKYFVEAYGSLKNNLVKLCNDLGYHVINFEEVG
jgi:hypothetical protein